MLFRSDLAAAQARLAALLDTARATGSATARLQTAWTALPKPKPGCDDTARLELGWRIERFGAAWREAAQAARVQADRVQRARASATVSPLIDTRWADELDALQTRIEHEERSFLEASAWEATFVRPSLAVCPVPPVVPAAGVAMLENAARGETDRLVAVLGLGDGWVCTGDESGAQRAEEAVVLVPGRACWSASPTCGCDAEPVAPGAILGPPVADGEAGTEAEKSEAKKPEGATEAAKSGEATPEAKPAAKPEAKSEAKPAAR